MGFIKRTSYWAWLQLALLVWAMLVALEVAMPNMGEDERGQLVSIVIVYSFIAMLKDDSDKLEKRVEKLEGR